MPVHHGRHEMPGWRGYLPDSVDRAARGRSGRPDRGLLGTPSRRVAAVGALAVCAVAGGAVITTRSAGPPDVLPGPADDATSVSAGSSAWTREATPVLTAIETEIDRTDEVRRRWDTSSVARRDGPPPRAVVALFGRQSELTEHRDALRSVMTAIRSGSAREAAMANAWQQLGAAQEMLRALDAGRSALGDPVEATVLRLALDQDAPVAFAGGPPSEGGKRATTPRTFEDTATVAVTAATSTLRESSVAATSSSAGGSGAVGVAREQPTPVTPAIGAVSEDAFRPGTPEGVAADATTETAGPDSVGLAAAPDRGGSVDDDSPTQDLSTSQGSSSSDPVRSTPSEPTMLTFDRLSSGAPDPESVGDEKAPLASDPDPDPEPDAETETETSASRGSSPSTGRSATTSA